MTREEAEFIRASFDGYRRVLLAEIGRHPGGELDELDAELVRQLVNRLRQRGRTGFRIAHYVPGVVFDIRKPVWINGGLNVLLWIRNQQYRPKVSQVEQEMVRLDMLEPPMENDERHVVEQRRQITAPTDYSARALPSASGLFGMPVAPTPTEPPSWLDRFPTRGDDAEDRVLINCLLHMSNEKAVETIDAVVAERAATQRRRTERRVAEMEKEASRQRVSNGLDGASAVLTMLRERRRQ
jgi:hypothetical protein